MTDERLTKALQAVLDPVAVPDRLTANPEALVRARMAAGPASRRPARWRLAVAVVLAAAVLGAAGLTAPGQKALAAVRGLLLTRNVQTATPAERAEVEEHLGALEHPDLMHLKPGETVETPYQKLPSGIHVPRVVYHGSTVQEMRAQVPELPLPTYLPPGPDAAAVISESYIEATPIGTTYWITYGVKVNGQPRQVQLQYQPATGPMPDAVDMKVYQAPERVMSRTVTVNGQEATAVSLDGGTNWAIYWQAPEGQGFVGGFLTLDELVKVAESIPMLQP